MGDSRHPDHLQRDKGLLRRAYPPNRMVDDTDGIHSPNVSPDIPPTSKAIFQSHHCITRKECAMADFPYTGLDHDFLYDGPRHHIQTDTIHPYSIHRLLLFGIRTDANRIFLPVLTKDVGIKLSFLPTPSKPFPTLLPRHQVPS